VNTWRLFVNVATNGKPECSAQGKAP